jgi:hypothetical protein
MFGGMPWQPSIGVNFLSSPRKRGPITTDASRGQDRGRGFAHRHKSNPWFKRGTLFRSAVDVLRRAGTPMTEREITDTLIADKAP